MGTAEIKLTREEKQQVIKAQRRVLTATKRAIKSLERLAWVPSPEIQAIVNDPLVGAALRLSLRFATAKLPRATYTRRHPRGRD